jgi:chemotaxis protein MotB
MVSASNRPIIIKKIKKVVGGGHHGGAWKVAYADFVTAMMAFFLLMWLINTTSPDQRRGIAEFFAPASVSRVSSGAGGLLEGTSFAESGVRNGFSAAVAASSEPQFTSNSEGHGQDSQTAPGGQATPSQDSLTRARSMRETAEFSRAEIAIRQAMQDMPDIAELSRQVLVEQTPEGLRIQIVDQEGRSMFAGGSAQPNERAQRLLQVVSGVIQQLPNRVTVSGHTDGSAPGARYASNWELSADRANAARRLLQGYGVPGDQIYQVAGRADSEPLFPDDPTVPGNRRITITLLREAPPLPADLDVGNAN